MSYGSIKGVNAQGHSGWVTIKCSICARKMDVTRQIVYKCPKCTPTINAYFCQADSRVLHYRCPYCREQLVLYTVKRA